jgi:hypothetical protein
MAKVSNQINLHIHNSTRGGEIWGTRHSPQKGKIVYALSQRGCPLRRVCVNA